MTSRNENRDCMEHGLGDFSFRPIKQWEIPSPSLVKRQMNLREGDDGMSMPFGIDKLIDDELGLDVEDLFLDMKQRETEFVSLSNYRPNASYIPYRRYLVDWMSDVGEQCNLHNSTVHVSIILLDKIFGECDVPRNQWQLFATACISVAAKYEEAEEHCPPIPDLLALTRLSLAGYTSLSFRDGEVDVLRCLQWKIRAIPPIHFIGYFLSKGVIFEDDTWQGRKLIGKIPKYVKKYTEFFCNLTLQEYVFQQYRPSQLASAITLASRVALQIEPKWRPELVALTGHEKNDILNCYHHVWSYYEAQFPGHGMRSISPRSVASDMNNQM